MRIVVAEPMHEAGREILQRAADLTYLSGLWQNPELLAAELAEARALIVRNETRVDAALLASAPRLRVVGRLGSGLDNIDQQELQRRSIALVHAVGINAQAVAEYVLAAMLHLARRLGTLDRAVRRGQWPRELPYGRQLGGRTLGLVGLGATGQAVARLASALQMRVIAASPLESHARASSADLVPRGTLEWVLSQSEFVSLHCPLQPDTYHLLNQRRLALLDRRACLINAARGGVVDELALYGMLKQGRLAGAALDVRDIEPPLDSRFAGLEQVLLTPHIAGVTEESQKAVACFVAERVLALLQQG